MSRGESNQQGNDPYSLRTSQRQLVFAQVEAPFENYRNQIKQCLINHFALYGEKKIQWLLNEMPIDDNKPKSLLREMWNLTNGGVKDEFLKTMLLQTLPPQTETILNPEDLLKKYGITIGSSEIKVTIVDNPDHSWQRIRKTLKAVIRCI